MKTLNQYNKNAHGPAMLGSPRVAGDASFSGQAVSFARIHFPSKSSIDPSDINTEELHR